MRRAFAFLFSITLILSFSVPAVADTSETLPKIISLPDGFQPEGVAIGGGHDIYAGSLETGAVYRADLRTGEGEIVVPPQISRIAVGLSFDERSKLLFVAGGGAGSGYVYDAQSGATVGEYQFTTEGSFVNDVVVTRDAAYFTDSFRPYFYRVPLGLNGQLPDASAVDEVALGGDFVFVPGDFNANGIDTTPNGKALIIVNTATGDLFDIDPETGNASLIDLGGGAVPSGDGILLDGNLLYVVQNFLNQIAVVDLKSDLAAGVIVGHIVDPAFDVPTTVAEFGNTLYAVNARFDTPPEPGTEYDIVQVIKER